MSREGIAGVDRDGGLEGAGLAGDALAIEDVAGAIDDQDIVGAVAGDVGHQGRGMRVVTNWPGAENVPSPLPSSTDIVSYARWTTARSSLAVAVKSPATIAWLDPDDIVV